MQDPRIRIFSIIILSLAAFASLWGAAAVFLWWLVFTPSFRSLHRSRGLVLFLISVLLFAFLAEIFSGNGISYGIRMGVIILIAGWAYGERVPGEFLSVSVWLFGRNWGFDLGLAAEMSVQGIEIIREDIGRAGMAHRIKRITPGIRTIVPATGMIIHQQLERARDQAEILAIRGYQGGGSICPAFASRWIDQIAGFSSILVLLFAFIPVRDVFILLH